MNTFKRWNGKKIEDWGSIQSDDAKAFYRAFKNYLKRTFPDCEIIGFKPNHYDCSGFINKDGNYIYISHSIDRSKERVDFNDSGVMSGVLYRTADGPKDYRGGQNNFCSLYKLEDCIKALFTKMEKDKAVTNEAKSINEKLYSSDEIQDMVSACKNDPKLKKKVLSKLSVKGPLGKQDKSGIEYVIDSGSAESFYRFDSDVCDKFIRAYCDAKGIKESSAVSKILNGANVRDVLLESL